MRVVIVESVAKAKTINKYLGSDYRVLPSIGHVRDLPAKDGSVEPDNDFAMHWEIADRGAKVMSEIVRALKGAEKLILATDPDREGEAISWHLRQILEEKKALKGIAVERVAFNAITKQAITEAMKHPREIDQPLVEAYLARRALDYLVGFNLSPVLWRKLPGSRSAGRVQSVALRLVCDREDEIDAFKTQEFWTLEADMATQKAESFKARLNAINGTTLKKFDIADETHAKAVKAAVEGGTFKVASVEKKPVRRNPWPPFTTSTLQQEASRKLGYSASRTMQIAQRLYEGVDIGGETTGLITYMRTDGVQIVPEAVETIRSQIRTEHGARYVAPFVREYKSKAKNAQEAHEAVRPTDISRSPAAVRGFLDDDGFRLYSLIWKRTLASQMASAELEQTTADIDTKGKDGKTYTLRATGSVVTFDGFLALYTESKDDEEDDDGRRLPALAQDDAVTAKAIRAEQHFTEPPPRYSDSSLIKKMEEIGIGRPSTYAATIATIVDREYVVIDKKKLIPQDKGRLVTAFLKSFFKKYVEFDFTAALEEKLDLISDDKLAWKQVLRDFWTDFTAAIAETKDLRTTEVLDALNEVLGPHVFPAKADGSDPRLCPACGKGTLSLKIGRAGAFIGCSNYNKDDPTTGCRFTRQFSENGEGAAAQVEGRVVGTDPETGMDITIRSGRFGVYLQLGEPASKEDKPKRSSIPKGFDAATLTLEQALALLNLPREVGLHPESGKPITAGLGRFGPFILHDGTYVNLDSPEEVFSVGINRAVTLIAEKKAGKGFKRPQAKVLRELGEHPEQGGKMEVMEGRYGPYIKHGDVNATIPRGTTPEALTVEQAVALIAEKAARGPSTKKPARKPAAKPKAAAEPKAKAPKAAAKTPAKTPAKTGAAAKKAPAKKPARQAAE